MSEKEPGNLPPEVELEQRASIYEIKPYKSSHEKLILYYNQGATLRWSLNKNNFNIKIWHSEDALHGEVDREGYMDGTTGYITKKRGVTYSDSRQLNDKEKTQVVFAIKKYLEV